MSKGSHNVTYLKLMRTFEVFTYRFVPLLATTWLLQVKNMVWYFVLLSFFLWNVSEIVVENSKNNKSARASQKDKYSRWFIMLAHLAGLWLPLLEYFLAPSEDSSSLIALGACVFALGVFIRLVAISTLGEFFTGHIQVTDKQKVCDNGIYNYIRHPSYVGLIFLNVAPAILLGTHLSFLAVLIMTILSNFYRVKLEEELLVSGLGEAYESYMRRTGRFIPKFNMSK